MSISITDIKKIIKQEFSGYPLVDGTIISYINTIIRRINNEGVSEEDVYKIVYASVIISDIDGDGATATATTATAHSYEAGDSIIITGSKYYNGTYTIVTVPSTTSFTFAHTSSEINESGSSIKIRDGYTYDNTNYVLTLNNNLKKIQTVFVASYEYRNVTYRALLEDYSSSDYVYALVGNKIYFLSDITGKEVLIKAFKSLTEIDSSTTTYTELNEDAKQVLISGAIYMIASKPSLKNENIFTVHKEIFNREFPQLIKNRNRFEPLKKIEPRYTW